MGISASTAPPRDGVGDRGFHRLTVRRIVPETSEASSFVLDVPPDLAEAFAYRAGQFCTFRLAIDGERHLRCYSMSSSPAVDAELQVTVKRVPGGIVSNWMNDTLAPGDELEVTRPAGVFCLEPGERDLVAHAAGSGITPVFSLVKTALATTSRRVRLLYANRDRDGAIFAGELDALAERYAGRFEMVHHFDRDKGFVDSDAVRALLDGTSGADHYICGPTGFMEIVESTLLAHQVDPARINIERFTPAEPVAAPPPAGGAAEPAQITVELDGRSRTATHHPGTTILQTAREMGMAPPFSCESGNCATCMAKVVEGDATMRVNNALTDDEVAGGWVLTCQAEPATLTVHVVYGHEEI